MKKANSLQSPNRINNIYQKQQVIIESQELQIRQMEEEIMKVKDLNQFFENQNQSIKHEVSGLHELIAAMQKEKIEVYKENCFIEENLRKVLESYHGKSSK